MPPQHVEVYQKYKKPLIITIILLAVLAVLLGLYIFVFRSKTTENSDLPYVLAEPITNVPATQTLEFEAGAESLTGKLNNDHVAEVFVDAGLTIRAPEAAVMVDTMVEIIPLDEVRFLDTTKPNQSYTDRTLPYKRGHWGFSNEYYILQKRDYKSGEKLKKPIVTKFTIAETPEKPAAVFGVNDKGVGHFKWSAVDGAQQYYIVRYQKSSKNGEILGSTTKTEWLTTEQDRFTQEAEITTQNRKFKSFSFSEDIMRSPDYDGSQKPEPKEYEYGVIADLGTKSSPMSFIDNESIIKRLPISEATYANQEITSKRWLENYDEIPTHLAITMADGASVRRTILPDLAQVKETPILNYDTTPTGEIINRRASTALDVPYTIDGTLITGHFKIRNYNKATIAQDVQRIADRNMKAQVTTGAYEVYAYQTPITRPPKNLSKNAPKVDYPVSGSNEFVRHIAANLIAGNQYMDISKFKSTSAETIKDAYQEALAQNVYAIGVKNLNYSPGQGIIKVEYLQPDSQARKAEQAAISKKVDEVVARIIKGGMSDEQKVRAINAFITDEAAYNYTALTASKNSKDSFVRFTDNFPRAWSAAGVLLDKTAVCAGYSMTFKALADKAGVETLYVTGLANGELHAWNKVKVGGKWRMVDATWNDTGDGANEYLLITDEQAGKLRSQSQDKYFMNDLLISRYNAN